MQSATRIVNLPPGDLLPTNELAVPTKSVPESSSAPATTRTAPGESGGTRPSTLDRTVKLGRISTICPAMHDVLTTIVRLARTDVTLTIVGETGTGKDVLAHLLHEESPRRSGQFVVFDCSAVPSNLMESEIFGHERGAFTGAVVAHAGAFERARGGTLFLDEIGELPLDLQPKLLRVLENRGFRRVGGTCDRPLDVRIVAATNRDLSALMAARQFREDLYFRLAASVISVPPLRERLADLPLLVASLLRDLGGAQVTIPRETLQVLAAHLWPGNVRELKNVLAAALAFVDGGVLEPSHLRIATPSGGIPALERLSLGGHRLENIEKAAIRQTLHHTGGNKTQAATMLGIAISTLYEKLKKYDLNEEARPGSPPASELPPTP